MTKVEIIKNLSKEELKNILEECNTYTDIFIFLFNKNSSSHIVKKALINAFSSYGLNSKKITSKTSSPIWSISTKDFKKLVEKASSIKEILNAFNLENKGSNYKTLKKRFLLENLNYNEFVKKSVYAPRNTLKYTRDEIFCENSSYPRNSLKKILLTENILINKCSICQQLPYWNNKSMTLILDHINGIYNDNRLINLRIVCPNCNSQLETTGGRNIKNNKIRPNEEEINLNINNLVSNKISYKEGYSFCVKCERPLSRNTNKNGVCRKCLSSMEKKSPENIFEVFNLASSIGYVKTGDIYGVSGNTIKKWLLNEHLNPLEKKNTENFIELVIKLKNFFIDNSIFPDTNSDKELFNFINRLRKKYISKTLKEEEIQILNKISERILTPLNLDEVFKDSLFKLELFIKNNMRTPKRTLKDKDESVLAEWIRSTYRTNNPERVERIKNLLSSYNL